MAIEIGSKELTFKFTVDQVNAILNVLGQAPFVQSANLVNLIQSQGAEQFAAIQAEVEAQEAANTVEEAANE
jgi:hypothetical protein